MRRPLLTLSSHRTSLLRDLCPFVLLDVRPSSPQSNPLPLLYVYRVLLTGIHLMRSGEVEADLVRLNGEARLTYVPELIVRKLAGPEQGRLDRADVAFHEREYERLVAELKAAHEQSCLPEGPSGAGPLNDPLVRIRLAATAAAERGTGPAA